MEKISFGLRLLFFTARCNQWMIKLTRLNIAWESDKKYKFSNGDDCPDGKCSVDQLKNSKYNITKAYA